MAWAIAVPPQYGICTIGVNHWEHSQLLRRTSCHTTGRVRVYSEFRGCQVKKQHGMTRRRFDHILVIVANPLAAERTNKFGRWWKPEGVNAATRKRLRLEDCGFPIRLGQPMGRRETGEASPDNNAAFGMRQFTILDDAEARLGPTFAAAIPPRPFPLSVPRSPWSENLSTHSRNTRESWPS